MIMKIKTVHLSNKTVFFISNNFKNEQSEKN